MIGSFSTEKDPERMVSSLERLINCSFLLSKLSECPMPPLARGNCAFCTGSEAVAQ